MFIYELNEYFISAVVAKWYFTLERTKKNLKGTFSNAVKYTIKSLGTIFVTSFITSLILFIRIVMEYVMKRVE